MLEQDALKFYSDRVSIIDDYHLLDVDLHYYPLIEYNDAILFHIKSVVSYCHRFSPQRFSGLTQWSLRVAYRKYKVLSIKGRSVSFRMIDKKEYKEIVK
jgi:hypothetical protein